MENFERSWNFKSPNEYEPWLAMQEMYRSFNIFLSTQGDLRKMWQDPFVAAGAKLKFLDVWQMADKAEQTMSNKPQRNCNEQDSSGYTAKILKSCYRSVD